jgi:S-adenosylmethionine:tRNA-ribosyltransferase-isomerase (queuine synthetase)
VITIDNESLLVVAHSSYGRILQYDGDIHELLNRYGQLPLPPYITYESSKESHYQPVVATLP